MPNNFITNAQTRTLKKRLEQLIAHSQELKFLVGFFYFSGWQALYNTLKEQDDIQIKILVGLDVDRYLGNTLEVALSGNHLTTYEITDRFFGSLSHALNTQELDNKAFYEQVAFFVDLLEQKRLHIKKTIDPNHAKLYLFKVKEEFITLLSGAEVKDAGKFITGSSNLTYAGLSGQNEFNVEIGDYGWKEAQKYFDDLWKNAVPITDDENQRQRLIQYIQNKSQAAIVSPFEAYVLVLKTYLDLMEQQTIKPYIVRLLENAGYKTYQYQLDAVNQALTIIEYYNGVIVADVVGLGKTLIACMIGSQLGKRGMVLCPPSIIGDENATFGWKKYLHDFSLDSWEVRSTGDLEKAANYLQEAGDDIEVIIVDEAHRFRNQDTQSYEFLSTICKNRTVILLTATPFNNAPADIFALLKLFIIPGKSKITLDEDLEARFAHYNAEFKQLSVITRYHDSGGRKQKDAERYYSKMFEAPLPINMEIVHRRAQCLANEIRKSLEPVLIRRNRLDLKNDPIYFKEVNQLSEIADPTELFFELAPEQSRFYDLIVNEYFGVPGRFKGAIYQPYLYEESQAIDAGKLDAEGNRMYLQQRNLFDFMRRLMVKRFESSFGAFAKSINNFKDVHVRVLEFIENSGGRYILDRNLLEKIYQSVPEEIDDALNDFIKGLDPSKPIPKHERIYHIADFDRPNEFIQDIKADLALMQELNQRIQELRLVEIDDKAGIIEDPKAKRLVAEITKTLNNTRNVVEPNRKAVIFSEYVDTVLYLQPILERAFPEKVLTLSGQITKRFNDRLLQNFDASIPITKQENEYDILLTSDKLSEGINLNRAGAIINYDIPWNPTRVIQRVGRINRIGKKVFETLHIYNFFPTEQGADIIQSRDIAAQKMFLIHNTLGEDAKIFDVDESPSPSELFKRINRHPEEGEQESTFTRIRKIYHEIKRNQPDVVEHVSGFPARVKSAKAFNENQLIVYFRKGLGFFVQAVEDTMLAKPIIKTPILDETLPLIECIPSEPRLALSKKFWDIYQTIKEHRETIRVPKSSNSLEVKAQNNLQSARNYYSAELEEYLPFIRTLILDLREYKTLPKFTLRRLSSVDLTPNNPAALRSFITEIKSVRGYLGDDYLNIIKERMKDIHTEIIISIENQQIY